ncbi:hypothetical protein ASD11_02535 [Aeromicrobium sp. Root495]|uniref:FMN-binding negative transcriptional regulator n=1 Tax=Aeromicrobium sp. Root495 TaxID=1736550 RepID=UPI0006F6F543|nr:FMN-binding negative transcriptional regulator [Aeromicrobium sp. Root495]KQY58557.1 hypothetical protein ASD11_02535 [Aeromicrobium sp. Root495]RYJ05513.1 MAG: FMN-binding negative transcriptional regulator [Actinomycetales bacterium]
MRPNPQHASEDPELVRTLVREHPWATIVSPTAGGLVASHYPVLLAPEAEDPGTPLALVTHLGRPDDRIHELSTSEELLVVLQGHHGYVSPSWYEPGSSQAPTWNFTAAHLHGRPHVMDTPENLATLTRLVAHFEQHVDEPLYLDPVWAERPLRGTVGLRIEVTRFELKVKMSQDKDDRSVQNVIDHLHASGPYSHPELARDMERERARTPRL